MSIDDPDFPLDVDVYSDDMMPPPRSLFENSIDGTILPEIASGITGKMTEILHPVDRYKLVYSSTRSYKSNSTLLIIN
jgi:hypothetical protein